MGYLGKEYWRREWDSNPRYSLKYTRFPSVRLKPLGHLSGVWPISSNLPHWGARLWALSSWMGAGLGRSFQRERRVRTSESGRGHDRGHRDSGMHRRHNVARLRSSSIPELIRRSPTRAGRRRAAASNPGMHQDADSRRGLDHPSRQINRWRWTVRRRHGPSAAP